MRQPLLNSSAGGGVEIPAATSAVAACSPAATDSNWQDRPKRLLQNCDDPNQIETAKAALLPI
jgi:hypothetical protein